MASSQRPSMSDSFHDHDAVLVYFDGGRHLMQGMPVDALREITVFEDLLYEVAKKQWHDAHPEEPVPKTVHESVRLRLTEVHDSSSVPFLVPDPVLVPVVDLLQRAYQGVAELLASVVETHSFPDDLPAGLRSKLRAFGASLQAAESAVLPRAGESGGFRYTAAHRTKAMRASAVRAAPSSGLLLGQIVWIEPGKQRFTFRGLDGRSIDGHYTAAKLGAHLERYLGAAGDSTTVVALQADYSQKVAEKPDKIVDVTHVDLAFVGNAPWSARMREIAQMRAGWLDGDGVPTSGKAMLGASLILQEISKRSRAKMRVYPTPDGLLQLEHGHDLWNMEILVDGTERYEVYYVNLSTNKELDREFSDAEAAAKLIAELLDE